MPSTSRGYPYPSGSDDVDIPGDMQALAAAVNTDVGTVVTNAVQHSLADAAGDVIVASANDAWARKALGTDNHVLTVDTSGSGAAKVAWEDPTANPLTVAAMAAKVNTATVGNLLTANQASLESNATTGWLLLSDCTIAASNVHAKAGTYSLAATYAGASYGDFYASASIPVTAGQTYTVSGQSYAGSVARTAAAGILWFNSGNSYLATTDGTNVTNSTSGWTRHLTTAVAPAGAFYARPFYRVNAAANTEVHYWDELGLWEGAGGQWALPGTPITNLGFYTDESCGRRLFQWDGNNARWQMTYGDTGLRDLTASITGSVQTSNPNLELKVRRVNSRVEWKLSETAPGSGSGTLSLLTADAGFRPAGVTAEREAMSSDNTGKPISDSACEVNTTGEVYLYGVIATRLNATVAYETTNAWPTTLPGTASGSIPA